MMRSTSHKQIRRLLATLALALGLTLALTFTPKSAPPTTQSPPKEAGQSLPEGFNHGVWLWESPQDISPKQLEESLEFAKSKQIRVIYLYMEDYITLKEGKPRKDNAEAIDSFNEKVRALITTANNYGIEIHALAGASNWTDASYQYLAPMLLDYVLTFNRSNPKEKFAGIQFDIEFYNKDGYKKNKTQDIANYLTLVEKLAQTVRVDGENSLSLGFAIPFWFDNGRGNAPMTVFHSKKQTILEHLLDTLQDTNAYLALMAYRNHAEGHNGTIAIVTNDLHLADKRGGKVKMYVGLETEKNEKGVTFYSQKSEDVNLAAHDITAAFSDSPSFSGIAIHTLSGYKKLNEK